MLSAREPAARPSTCTTTRTARPPTHLPTRPGLKSAGPPEGGPHPFSDPRHPLPPGAHSADARRESRSIAVSPAPTDRRPSPVPCPAHRPPLPRAAGARDNMSSSRRGAHRRMTRRTGQRVAVAAVVRRGPHQRRDVHVGNGVLVLVRDGAGVTARALLPPQGLLRDLVGTRAGGGVRGCGLAELVQRRAEGGRRRRQGGRVRAEVRARRCLAVPQVREVGAALAGQLHIGLGAV